MGNVEIRGIEPLLKAIQTGADNTKHKAVVKRWGGKLEAKAKSKAVFSKGYSKGALKQSINLEITDGGFTAKVEAGKEYSGYLEVGTRYMEAQPFMKPAFEEIEPQFIEDLRKASLLK